MHSYYLMRVSAVRIHEVATKWERSSSRRRRAKIEWLASGKTGAKRESAERKLTL
jgi:hypothetical protein